MKKTFPLALALLLLAAGSAAAQTQGPQARWAENRSRSYESSQWFAFELKFGGYTPHIDSSPGLNGATPFADLFNPQGVKGQPPERLLSSVEFDVQFLHKFGSLGAGLSLGYGRRTTHSFQYMNSNGTGICTPPMCTRSGDQTALNMFPVEAMLVYRFDVLALRYKIPLVPFVKLGLAYWFWWIENGSGGIAQALSDPKTGGTTGGYGGTFGWVFNPGLAFMLDVLDPSAARTMDGELGINHSYVFAELHYADISGFGAANKLVLSDVSWNVGLAFEF